MGGQHLVERSVGSGALAAFAGQVQGMLNDVDLVAGEIATQAPLRTVHFHQRLQPPATEQRRVLRTQSVIQNLGHWPRDGGGDTHERSDQERALGPHSQPVAGAHGLGDDLSCRTSALLSPPSHIFGKAWGTDTPHNAHKRVPE